jgi:hypothetical protein
MLSLTSEALQLLTSVLLSDSITSTQLFPVFLKHSSPWSPGQLLPLGQPQLGLLVCHLCSSCTLGLLLPEPYGHL